MIVLDASAALAWIYQEDGHDIVDGHLDTGEARISAVNWSETLQKIAFKGGDADQIGAMLQGLGLEVTPFNVEQAATAANLFPLTSQYGLSLGDRACLALGLQTRARVLTSDRPWVKLTGLNIEIELIR